MAYLIIAGVTYPVTSGRGTRGTMEFAGTSSRSFNNTLRSTRRNQKRNWTMTLEPQTTTVCDTLEAAIANATYVTVSGDAIAASGSISAEVTVTNAIDEIMGAAALMRTLTLAIREV